MEVQFVQPCSDQSTPAANHFESRQNGLWLIHVPENYIGVSVAVHYVHPLL